MRRHRIVRVALATVVGVWLIYLVGMNTFLGFRIFERVIADAQDDVRITFDSAWSWWPGWISATNLRIQGQDSMVEWVLDVDELDMDVDLSRLAAREFRVNTATVSGAVFWARGTRSVAALCGRRAAPSIPGLSDSRADDCLNQPETARLEAGDTLIDELWRVHLVHIVGHDVRDIWIDDARLRGHVEVRGGWYFWPTIQIAFDGVHLDVHTATATWGRMVRGRDVELDAYVGSATISIGRAGLIEVFDDMTIRAKGRAQVDVDVERDDGKLTIRDATMRFEVDAPSKAVANAKIDIDIRRGDARAFGLSAVADVYAKGALQGRAGRLSFAGTRIDVNNALFRDADGKIVSQSWNARVASVPATIKPDGPALTGVLRFDADDGHFLATLGRKELGLPGWIIDALAAAPPSGNIELARYQGRWSVRRAEVLTGPLRTLAHGRYDKQLEAALLFSSGGLAAAVTLDGPKSNVIVDGASAAFHDLKPSW